MNIWNFKGRIIFIDHMLSYVPPMHVKALLRLIMIPFLILFFPQRYFLKDVVIGFSLIFRGEADFGIIVSTGAFVLFLLAIILCYFTIVDVSVVNGRIIAKNVYYIKFGLRKSNCRLICPKIWRHVRLSFMLTARNVCLPVSFGLIHNEQSLRDLVKAITD